MPPAIPEPDEAAAARAACDPRPPYYGLWHWAALTLFLAGYAWLHVFLANQLILQTNEDPRRSDQKHNMKLALMARDFRLQDVEAEGMSSALRQWVPHHTDGVVNPLWPWVASWVAPDAMTPSAPDVVNDDDRLFFRRGKWLNVTATGAFLLVTAMVAGRWFTLLGAINFTLLAGLGVFLRRSTFFQPEPLYFVFFFLTWVAAIAILKRNSLWWYACLGVVSGLAWLAKTSIAPLLAVFFVASGYRFLGSLFPTLLGAGGGERGKACAWSAQNHFIGLLIFACAHLFTVGPRLDYANSVFGDPFHSYPKYWMWMDDFPEAFAWMGDHPSKRELEAVPELERPSAAKFLREHTGAEAWDRLRGEWTEESKSGLEYVLRQFLAPVPRKQDAGMTKPWKYVLPWRGLALGWLAFSMVVVAVAYTRHRERSVFPSHRIEAAAVPITLFVVGAVAAYALAYAWYTPIGKGDRFMMSLFAPLAFSLIAASESLVLRVRRRGECLWIIRLHNVLQLALTTALVWRISELLRNPTFTPGVGAG